MAQKRKQYNMQFKFKVAMEAQVDEASAGLAVHVFSQQGNLGLFYDLSLSPAGYRTPLFLTTTGWSRYSWYLRLANHAGPAGGLECGREVQQSFVSGHFGRKPDRSEHLHGCAVRPHQVGRRRSSCTPRRAIGALVVSCSCGRG